MRRCLPHRNPGQSFAGGDTDGHGGGQQIPLRVLDRLALCRTCYDVCPFKGKAIVLHELRPVVAKEACTGCGLCTHACPITTAGGWKAVNIEPPTTGGPSSTIPTQ